MTPTAHRPCFGSSPVRGASRHVPAARGTKGSDETSILKSGRQRALYASQGIAVFGLRLPPDPADDEAKTGRVRCIGCGRFVAAARRWNQCADCDTREPEEMR